MLPDIEAALEARVAQLPNEASIAWWGRAFVPVVGQPYLHATISSQSASPIAYGAEAPELWEGFLQLTVAHPRAEGPQAARMRAIAVRDHFPRGLAMISNATRVIVMARSIQPAVEAIDWLNYPVLINWICEEVRA